MSTLVSEKKMAAFLTVEYWIHLSYRLANNIIPQKLQCLCSDDGDS